MVLELKGLHLCHWGDVVSTTIAAIFTPFFPHSQAVLRIFLHPLGDPVQLHTFDILLCFRCCKATEGGSGLGRAGEASLGRARNEFGTRSGQKFGLERIERGQEQFVVAVQVTEVE